MIFVQNFTIKDKLRLSEFLSFKEVNLPKTILRYAPALIASHGEYKVSIRSNMADIVSLEPLFDKWKMEDKKASPQNQNLTLLDKFFGKLRA